MPIQDDAFALVATYSWPGYPDWMHLGPLGIAAVVREAGFRLHFVDYQQVRTAGIRDMHDPVHLAKHVLEQLEGAGPEFPGIIGFSCMLDLLPTVLVAAGHLQRAHPEILVLLGGPGPSLDPAQVLEAGPGVDVVVFGEAEHTLAAWLGEYRDHPRGTAFPTDLPGVAYRLGEDIQVNPPAPRIRDLDALPGPAHDLHRDTRFLEAAVETSRGCPYDCVFCDSKTIWGRHVEHYSVGSVLARIDHLLEVFPDRDPLVLSLTDDVFTLDRTRVLEFCRGVRERPCSWNCFARLDLVDLEMLQQMRASGCEGLYFGVDSGSPRLLEILGKRLTLEQIHGATDLVASVFPPEEVTLSYMWGFPEETLQDFRATLRLLSSHRAQGFATHLYFLNPIPGSPVHREHAHHLRPLRDLMTEQNRRAFEYASQAALEVPAISEIVHRYPRLFSHYFHAPSPDLEVKAAMVARLVEDLERPTEIRESAGSR